MQTYSDIYLQRLKSGKVSSTKPRKLIFETLLKNGHSPLTMQQLVNKCIGKVDRASIYRNVELLEKIGVIKKIHTGWKYKIELSDEFHGHHHHLICSVCHKVIVSEKDLVLEKVIIGLGKLLDFSVENHSLEIYGKCKKCS